MALQRNTIWITFVILLYVGKIFQVKAIDWVIAIPTPLEEARFRKSERFITKAPFFIKGYSLKKKGNAGYDLLSLPQGLV